MTDAQPAPVKPDTSLPADEADLPDRIEGFNKEILPLLGKYELGLAAMPKIVGDGRIVADPIIVSVRGRKEAVPAEATPAPAPDAGLSKVE